MLCTTPVARWVFIPVSQETGIVGYCHVLQATVSWEHENFPAPLWSGESISINVIHVRHMSYQQPGPNFAFRVCLLVVSMFSTFVPLVLQHTSPSFGSQEVTLSTEGRSDFLFLLLSVVSFKFLCTACCKAGAFVLCKLLFPGFWTLTSKRKTKWLFTYLIVPLPISCNLSCRFQLLNQKNVPPR